MLQFVLASALAAQPVERLVQGFRSVAVSPNGRTVIAIETPDAPPDATEPPQGALVLHDVATGSVRSIVPCERRARCKLADATWSNDGRTIAFLSRDERSGETRLLLVDADGSRLRTAASLRGELHDPRFARGDATIAVLATASAHKLIGAVEAGAPIVGEVGATSDEQRIAILEGGALRMVSPADMFVYEYDWLPDGRGFVGTAAHGNGDNNWWVARLYAFGARGGAPRELYKPPLQIAGPRASPDGKYVAFIGGLMSDFGSTGGDVYVVPLAGGSATDVTANTAASADSVQWNQSSAKVTFTALAGARHRIGTVDLASHAVRTVWESDASITANNDADVSFAHDARTSTFASETYEKPPELYVGAVGAWRQLSRENAGIRSETHARSVGWTSDGFHVQGWLLAPLAADPAKKYPMIVEVHGGPGAAAEPRFVGRGTERDLLRHGYYVFEPNPRGSFGQGEAFARANVKDFGYGDFRDILAGVDASERAAPIDDARLGLYGHSYGGYMTMWGVTQTQRFKAAVAGAGVANWLSYYGENGIDEWMIPFFGASVYDDPAVYARSSPITFIKNVKTPTFIYVGEHDVECPAPQSQEYWHALATLGVPTSLVVYEGEGHHFRNPAHVRDLAKRIVGWFDRYLKQTVGS